MTLLAALCLVTAPASAAPAPDKQTQADQLAQQLDDQGQHIAALDEQYNQAQAKADAISQQLAAIEPKLTDSNQQLTAARQRLSQASVDAYIHGGSSPLLGALLKSTASDFGVRRTYVNAALDEQRGALAQFDTARRKLLKTRDQLRAAQSQARAAAAAIDANRKAIEATVASQQATMQQVTQPGMAPLVAQAAADRAQQQQAQGKQRFDQLAAPAPPSTTTVPRGPAVAAPTKPAGGSGSGPATTARPAPPTTTAPKPASPPPPTPVGPAPPVKPGAATAVNVAKAQLGKPYQWAAAGPDSFDCSGLVMYAWHAGGVSFAHSAAMQYDETARIALSQLQPGDLVFFYTPIEHVGIYVGGGQMIDAPYTGAFVRYDSIYNPYLVGAGRP